MIIYIKMFLCDIERQWHKIEKWQKNSNYYTNTYQYILDNGFIPYFRCMKDGFEVYPNPQLNLPVPFKSGDIIIVCDRPFADEKQALILDVGNNIDCDCVQVLYVTNNGIVKVNSLKHGHIFEDNNALMYTSPLYKAKKFKGNTEDIHKVLLMVQRYMADKLCASAVLISALKDKELLSDDITIEKLNSLLSDKTD